uniref:spermatogenesis-associated protein 7 n=1 Tax=Semicossyphus pulcher TaxID=241346 RepID=UPI0037E8BB42
MGYAECDIVMESRTAFCPRSSSKLTQSIIKDHMVSHYKKVYSAKAAIDASVPKSLIHSVKYNDQIRQERLRKGGRPQSAHSLSQRDSRASCSSAQSTSSVQYDESPYLFSRSSMVSSPRFNTSFHAKETVYPSFKVGPQSHSHHTRPASEIKYRSPEATLRRRQSACSLAAMGDHSCYKTFQDPVQKTYSGDLLQKHSQRFTSDKPFTPKTLKSDKSSYLSKYRYYRAPPGKPTQDCTKSRLMRQETYHGSTKTKDYTHELYEPSQGFNTEHEWSEEEFNGTSFTASTHQSRANRSRDGDFFHSSRVSPSGKSPIMKSISTEEEELMYLEFISAVTGDILSRAHISDRVLDQVMKRHIDMNRRRLDEGKMRHLLEVLRKDFEEPTEISTSGTEPENNENGLLDTFLPHLESRREKGKTKENKDLFSYTSLIKNSDAQDYADQISVSTPLCSSERTASPTKTIENNGEDDNLEKGITSPWLSEHVPDNTGVSEEDFNQNQIDTTASNKEVSNDSQECSTVSSDKAFHEDKAEDSYDGQSEELADLGKSFSESLRVSNNTQYNNVETTEQHANTVSSVSDDEF